MKLGIIGTGMIVKMTLPAITATPGIEVVTIQGSPRGLAKAMEIAAEYHIPNAMTSFAGMLTTDIDTVYVAVPNALHYSYCKQALENGLNVIVEKPFAVNSREADELWALAKEKNLFLIEAVTIHFLGNYEKIKEWLPRIGDIKLASCRYSQYSSRYDRFMNGDIAPAFDPAQAGGALMDLNLYCIHFVQGLLGEPKEVHYSANIDKGIDTSGIVTLTYPKFSATAIAAKDSNGDKGCIIQGTKGYIKTEAAPNLVGKVTLVLNDGTVETYDNGEVDTNVKGEAISRFVPEFAEIARIMNEKDHEKAERLMEQSLAVSRTITAARKDAGIVFPQD